MNFTRAKKQLKAFLSRRSESVFSEDEGRDSLGASTTLMEGISASTSKPAKHNMKISRLHRNESCALCNKNLTGILIQGYKCMRCKLSFHKECSSFACNIPCQATPAQSPRPEIVVAPKKVWEIK
ncbi:unnamed protein product [Gongylonema pulchrum]|uniref:Phorbol-ester/DAG-type domain-containing protein n=1 Tax=Gongylonema pulchrum TaxID=637853 RepID=A0A183DCC9_9BILA|nr:unnamed protein product [Gongylonema pulchrum]